MNEQRDMPEFIQKTLSTVGDKWTVMLLHCLQMGPQRFTEFENTCKVNPRTLSQRLDKLEQEGLIEKQDDGSYKITKMGRDLKEAVYELVKWGAKHYATPAERKKFEERAKKHYDRKRS